MARAARRCARSQREGLWRFGEGFSEVFERAVLRRRLRVERQELRRIASWADGRSAELSDGAIDLARDRQLADGEEGGRPPAARSALHELLTPREIDVLEHLVKGETNAEIARTLIVSEGTVKFHVKNILRKMNVGQPRGGDLALPAPRPCVTDACRQGPPSPSGRGIPIPWEATRPRADRQWPT